MIRAGAESPFENFLVRLNKAAGNDLNIAIQESETNIGLHDHWFWCLELREGIEYEIETNRR